MSGDSPVSLGDGEVLQEREKALLVSLLDLDVERWIPKSVLHDNSEVYDGEENSEGEVIVKAWWAEKEGLP